MTTLATMESLIGSIAWIVAALFAGYIAGNLFPVPFLRKKGQG